MQIKLDYANRATVKRERGQIIIEFVVGSSTIINMAVTLDGARTLSGAIASALMDEQK